MVQLMPLPPDHLLLQLNPDWFYLSASRLTWVVLVKWLLNWRVCVISFHVLLKVTYFISLVLFQLPYFAFLYVANGKSLHVRHNLHSL